MAFNKIPFLFLILIFTKCFSQSKSNSEVTDVTKATFLNPGISYEKKVGKFQTLYAQAFMNTSFTVSSSDALGNTSNIYFDPALTLQYRYYYNSVQRQARGKRIEMNSSNYVSVIAETDFSKGNISSSYSPEKNRRAINTFGIAWGLQRNYQKRFSFDINLGPGYLFAKTTATNDSGQFIHKDIGELTAVGQLNIGFWLNKRN